MSFLHQSNRIIVFGRYPLPGRTKTRLIHALGPTGAAELQRLLTEKTLRTVRAAVRGRSIGVEACFDGGDERRMRRWLGSDLTFSQQGAGDLGERMHRAFLEAFKGGCRQVILLGTDIPAVAPEHLVMAFAALKEHDLVLGPSRDGGYWLMGMKRPVDLFQDIAWGTGKVLDRTVSRAKARGLRISHLETLTDIDRLEDLKQWQTGEWNRRPYLSVIIPTLNEGANIEETIRRARNEDAEILVIDGESSDDTVMRAAEAGARVVKGPKGRAVQQNMGAASSSGRVLLFLHADTHLPHDYLRHIFEVLMNPRAVAGAFLLKTDLNHPLMKTVEVLANLRSRYLKLPYGDQGLFLRRSDFDAAGGFPEVEIAEDLYLMRRLSKRGRIETAPVSVVSSARRWRRLGVLRTTLLNQFILAGCCLGLSPRVLAPLYRFRP